MNREIKSLIFVQDHSSLVVITTTTQLLGIPPNHPIISTISSQLFYHLSPISIHIRIFSQYGYINSDTWRWRSKRWQLDSNIKSRLIIFTCLSKRIFFRISSRELEDSWTGVSIDEQSCSTLTGSLRSSFSISSWTHILAVSAVSFIR